MTNHSTESSPTEPLVFDLHLAPLTLEAGATVKDHVVRGSIWGPTIDSRSDADVSSIRDRIIDTDRPVVLVVHALTGDMRPGGSGGWWAPLVGPGKALDTDELQVLCFNNLGSCYGTVGPADPHRRFPMRDEDRPPLTAAFVGKGSFTVDRPEMPATVTTWDQARSILMSLDALGLQRVHLAIGGSLGGMIVLACASLAPERFERVAPIGATERSSPWVIGWNHIGRQVILASPEFPEDVTRALELARQLAHMTYRAELGLWDRQGRALQGASRWTPQAPYAVQTYLEHQGRKLVRRFDGRSYLVQLDAMDHHDLTRAPPDPGPEERWRPDDGGRHGLDRFKSSCLAVGIEGDVLFDRRQMMRLATLLEERGCHTEYAEIVSKHGHDAFLIEWSQMEALIERALSLPRPSQSVASLMGMGGTIR